jgi:predicted amidohydrolase
MKDSIALIEIDLKNIDKARKEWPFFKDRKPEIYREIIQDTNKSIGEP